MKTRNLLVFLASLLDEVIILALLFWSLNRLGVSLPLPAIALILLALGVYAIITYRLIIKAINKKQVIGLSDMVGMEGEVVRALEPQGTVRIAGELWQAVSETGTIAAGQKIIITARDSLKLTVRRKT